MNLTILNLLLMALYAYAFVPLHFGRSLSGKDGVFRTSRVDKDSSKRSVVCTPAASMRSFSAFNDSYDSVVTHRAAQGVVSKPLSAAETAHKDESLKNLSRERSSSCWIRLVIASLQKSMRLPMLRVPAKNQVLFLIKLEKKLLWTLDF